MWTNTDNFTPKMLVNVCCLWKKKFDKEYNLYKSCFSLSHDMTKGIDLTTAKTCFSKSHNK